MNTNILDDYEELNETLLESKAKKIGQKYGLIAIAKGIVIAQVLLIFIVTFERGTLGEGLLWFCNTKYFLNLIVGILMLSFFGYFFAGIAGKKIIIARKNPKFVGFYTGILALTLSTVFMSWIVVAQTGIDTPNSMYNSQLTYVFISVFMVAIIGLIPIIIVGEWFGEKVAEEGKALSLK